MPAKVDSYGITVQGTHQPNQDQFLIARLYKTFVPEQSSVDLADELEDPIRGKLLVVADGVSGRSGGEVASQTAVESLAESVRAATPWLLDDAEPELEMTERLEAACKEAHRAILQESAQSCDGRPIGTALTAALLIGSRLYLAHAGHCRCYRMRDGVLKQLTEDQTEAAALPDLGVIDQDGTSSPAGKQLWSCLGAGRKPSVETDARDYDEGDSLLLCTDSLYRHVSEDRIAAVLGHDCTAEAACRELIALARDAGASDDITAIVIHPSRRAQANVATAAADVSLESVGDQSEPKKPEFGVEHKTAAVM